MQNRRKSLPPLDTLIFFEAAIREGSFSAAAGELYVSQAAVSKRVKQLETWLGVELFERGARSLELTQAGAGLAEPVVMALDYLQGALEDAKAPTVSAVRIAANSAVSVFWLFPRLKAFALSPQSCSVETITKDDPRALLSEANDLAIIYADCVPQGWSGQLLMEEELAPVVSPEGKNRVIKNPDQMVLLDYRRHAPDWINWDIWEQRAEMNSLKGLTRRMCQSYGHSIGQALEGHGIALASCRLLGEDLASGRLTAVADVTLKTGKGYYLVWPTGRETMQGVSDLIGFLRQS